MIPLARPLLRQVARDDRGGAVTEFAIVAPVMCIFLVAGLDVAHSLYFTATLQGIVQKTARDSSLESNATSSAEALVDAKVSAQVYALVNHPTNLTFTRRYYRTFALAQQAKAETWSDTDHDGTCDHNESYQDANGNGVWDADGGDAGEGGARDKTVYTVSVTYQHLLPVWKLLGWPNSQTMTARTVLQNQPYGDQAVYSTTIQTRTCT